jgi:2-keto-4-pentenoate hydratase/2-oxohepta-3-ene-1,7-dioic acid hydratase in catechol pathway
MRVGNLAGRLTLFTDTGPVDVEKASDGRFAADPQAVYEQWAAFREWADAHDVAGSGSFEPADLGCPTPGPAQIFAIGLNYHSHAAEAGVADPGTTPLVFTKFRTSLTGPVSTVDLPQDDVDWEAELVVVIGRRAHRISAADAWDHVAGLAVGQDLSARTLQMSGAAPQFGLAKSYPGFSPVGPWLVTPDELPDPNALQLECTLNGQIVQHESTSDMIFPVPTILEFLSSVTPMLPGDIVFTGTPAGVGVFREPNRFLRDGDEVITTIDGIGHLRQTFTHRHRADPA